MRTAYDILGVHPRASEETIKTAFHRAAKAYHPDLNAGDPAAEQKLRQVLAAYQILKCPEQRAAYDLQLTDHRRVLARRLGSAAFVGLATGGLVALGVYLSVSPSHKQVASVPAAWQASLAMEWERVEASGDPKAIWAFAVRNPDTPQSGLARSRLMELMETVEDVSLLNVFRLVASEAVAERARERLVRLGALATKEDVAPSSNADTGEAIEVVGRKEPQVQEPVSVTAKAAAREEPAVKEAEAVTTAVAVREEPVPASVRGTDTNAAGNTQLAQYSGRLRIYVVSATYGGNCGAQRGNVTYAVSRACNGRRVCPYAVHYRVLGDPARGCGKDFTVRWECGDGEPRRAGLPPEAGYGSQIVLSCGREY